MKVTFLLVVLGLVDFIFCVPVIWKITRTEAWVRVADPALHHAFRPMSFQTEQYGPKQGQIFINSLGGKDDSCREISPRGDRPRVAVFGDSFAEGWGLPFAETVPGQLRGRLAPISVDVLGFGIASHCPSLTERWMRKLLGEGVRWNLAILLIDPGDSFDEQEVKAFLEGRERKVRKNVPQFFRLRWYEYSLTWQVSRRVHEWLAPHKKPLLDLRQAVRGNDWKVAWLNDTSAAPWFQNGLEQSARAVEKIQNLAQAVGFPLLIAVYPYPKMMAEKKLQNSYNLFWKKFSEQRGIAFVDLAPLFEEPGKSPEEIYAENFLAGDFHWNSRGSSRVADALLPWIEKNLPSAKGKSIR